MTRARIPAIDGLRGVAILMVLYFHAPHLFYGGEPHPLGEGWLGVDLFFVVSGFLITGILLRMKARREPLLVFWKRRAARIFPLAYLYLGILYVGARAGTFPELADFHRWTPFFLYVSNFDIAAHGWAREALNPLWSLAIEEQFYLVWPVLVWRLSRKALVRICVATVVLSPILRLVLFDRWPLPAMQVSTFARLDALATGCLLALLFDRNAEATLEACRDFAPLAGGVAALVLVHPWRPCAPAPAAGIFLGYSMAAVSFTVLLGAALGARLPKLTVLRWLGERCYGLYIWHIVVGQAVHHFGRGRDPLELSIVWLFLTCGVAALSYRYFESPIREALNQPLIVAVTDVSRGSEAPPPRASSA